MSEEIIIEIWNFSVWTQVDNKRNWMQNLQKIQVLKQSLYLVLVRWYRVLVPSSQTITTIRLLALAKAFIMLLHLSFYSCWLPRTVHFSTKAIVNNTSVHRSTSRFSLKIARFLFLKRRLKCDTSKAIIASTSTHVHHSKTELNKNMHLLARSFVMSLEPEHRKILHDELVHLEKSSTHTDSIKIYPSQLAIVFLETGLPYLGFGFVDNFIMLVAGDAIETFFGAAFCLSTMAAAGFGNAVSDVMGIGLADRIERTCGRILSLFGIDLPKLTRAHWSLRSVQLTQLFAKIICIFLGCVLGMCPLLFRDTSANKTKSTD